MVANATYIQFSFVSLLYFYIYFISFCLLLWFSPFVCSAVSPSHLPHSHYVSLSLSLSVSHVFDSTRFALLVLMRPVIIGSPQLSCCEHYRWHYDSFNLTTKAFVLCLCVCILHFGLTERFLDRQFVIEIIFMDDDYFSLLLILFVPLNWRVFFRSSASYNKTIYCVFVGTKWEIECNWKFLALISE